MDFVITFQIQDGTKVYTMFIGINIISVLRYLLKLEGETMYLLHFAKTGGQKSMDFVISPSQVQDETGCDKTLLFEAA